MILGLGLVTVAGLALSPRSVAPPVPAGLVAGPPGRPVSIVLVDGGQRNASAEILAAAATGVGPASPDVVMMAGVEAGTVPAVASALGMERTFHPQLYQRAMPSADGRRRSGVVILSRLPIFSGEPVVVEGRTVGVRAVADVDGRAFGLTCYAIEGGASLTAPAVWPNGVVAGSRDGTLAAAMSTDLASAVAPASIEPGDRRSPPPAFAFTVRPVTTTTSPATHQAPSPR